MNIDEYQEFCASRASDIDGQPGLILCGLGVAGEAGECADLVKKHVFHGHPLKAEKLKKELGDVLWYVAMLARNLGFTMTDVINANVEKLVDRYPNGFTKEASINRRPETDGEA